MSWLPENAFAVELKKRSYGGDLNLELAIAGIQVESLGQCSWKPQKLYPGLAPVHSPVGEQRVDVIGELIPVLVEIAAGRFLRIVPVLSLSSSLWS